MDLDLNKSDKQQRSPGGYLPLVTIVPPCFNSAAFIEQTIHSVAKQRETYPRIEHIIVDGGSTDGTVEIIRANDRHVSMWVSEPDKGQADALRKGFQMSSGEVLAWINSDDVYADGAIASAIETLLNSEADVVYGHMGLIDHEGNRIGDRRLAPFLRCFSRQGMLYGGFGVYQPASFWRRQLYFEVGGVDPTFRFTMDTDLFVRFALAGARFQHFNRELVDFRLHESSKTSTILHVATEEWHRIQRSLPPRSWLYRMWVRTVCRTWKVLYHLKDSRGAYLYRLLTNRRYRFMP